MGLGLMNVDDGAWSKVRINFAHINKNLLGPTSTPTFGSITLTGGLTVAGDLTISSLTASRLVWTDADKKLASKDLVDLIAGTANEIDIADDGDGSVTIGLINPLIVAKGGIGTDTLTDHGLLLGSGVGAVTALAEATNGQLPIGSTGVDPVLATLTAGAGIVITNAAGSITVAVDGVLEDLDFLGANAADSEFLVGTGAGALAWESGDTVRTSLGLAIGTNVQAWDATLTSIAALGTAADKIIYTTDVDTWAESSITVWGRALIDDANQAAMRNTLQLGTGDHPQFDGLGLGEAGVLGQIQVTSAVNAIQRIDFENTSAGNVARAGFIARADAAQWVMDAFGSGHNDSPNDVRLTGISSTEFLIWARRIGDAGDFPTMKLLAGSTDITIYPATTLITVTGGELCLSNFHELRFYDDGANYVGFEAPALTADKIWVLPNADGGANELLKTDGAGNLGWTATAPPGAHLHDGDVLECDGIDSNAGAFSFDTGGLVTFDSSILLDTGADITVSGHVVFNTNNSYIGFTDPRLTFDDINNLIQVTGKFTLPDSGYLGCTSDTTALQILPAGDIVLTDNLYTNSGLYILERAATVGAVETWGHIWVKNTSPNQLWFTDDAGNDTRLDTELGTDIQAWDAGLDSLAALSYASAGFIKVTAEDTYTIRTIGETADDLEATIDHDNLANGGAHDYAYISGNDGATDVTAAQLEELTDGSETTLHSHAGGADAFTVKVDAAATAGYLGTANSDGVLRTDGSNITYTDGGDFVTLTTAQGIQETSTPTFAGLTLDASAIPILTAEYVDEGGGVEACRLRLLNDNSVVMQFSSVTTDDSYINNGGNFAIGRASAYTKLTVEGAITLKEQADADGDNAGYGQIWVHDDEPNTLWFTNDVGTDVQLGVGSGGGSGSIHLFGHNIDSVTQGTWAATIDNSYMFNHMWSNSTSADGDEIHFSTYMAAGTYTCNLQGRRNTNQGIVKIYIGEDLVATFDKYGTSLGTALYTQTGISVTAGLKDITYVIDGKNGSSSDYFGMFGVISFYRTV